MNKERLYAIFQICGWSIFALFQIVYSYDSSGSITTRRLIFFIIEAFICLGVTHIFRNQVRRWAWLSFPIHKLVPSVFIAVFAMALIVYFLKIPVNVLLGRLFNPQTAFDVQQILGQSIVYSIVFFLWTVFYFTYHYFDQYNKSLKYEASMIEIELNNLKSQLNPHFIFNALNSIRALVDENPRKSKQAINQLSNILRKSLASDKQGLTNFDDELKIVKDYLGLESIRFEERLKTEFDIHPESQRFLVPPLMIQTLVENGIKHGVSKLTKGGIIHVKTYVDNDRLKILNDRLY